MTHDKEKRLRQKIVLARALLNTMKKQHVNCQYEYDPDFYSPVCTCGADMHNTAIDKVLEILSLEKK
ncbi:MAG: hypothetical protein ACOYUZ_06615 [Patescibacteria group bacterium]